MRLHDLFLQLVKNNLRCPPGLGLVDVEQLANLEDVWGVWMSFLCASEAICRLASLDVMGDEVATRGKETSEAALDISWYLRDFLCECERDVEHSVLGGDVNGAGYGLSASEREVGLA